MKKYYLKFLQWLCKKELKQIADKYPITSKEAIIRYYDFMAIECINIETESQRRILNMSLSTVKALEI